MTDLPHTFSRLESPTFWQTAAALPLEGEPLPYESLLSRATSEREATLLREEGTLHLPGILSLSTCQALEQGAASLASQGIPALFLYAYAPIWQSASWLSRAVETITQVRYSVLADFWAWRIPEGPTHRGWTPHRGVSEPNRMPDGLPGFLNLWIAVADATPENGCMYGLPLCDDPNYPTRLRSLEAPADKVRAMPAAKGDVLGWDANMLHWGGPSTRRAKGPRVSYSFTLRHPKVSASNFRILPEGRIPPLRERLDLIAEQVLRYSHSEPSLPKAVLEWARITEGLRVQFGRR